MLHYMVRDANENCIGIIESLFILYEASERLSAVVGREGVTAREITLSEYETYKEFGFLEYIVFGPDTWSSKAP